MECRDCTDNLTAFLDGELLPEERKLVETHLASCTACGREHDAHGYAYRLVDSSLTRLEPVPAIWGRVLDGISGGVGIHRVQPAGVLYRLTRSWMPLAAAAGLAGALLLGVFDGSGANPEIERQLQTYIEQREKLTQSPERIRLNPFAIRKVNLQDNPFAPE